MKLCEGCNAILIEEDHELCPSCMTNLWGSMVAEAMEVEVPPKVQNSGTFERPASVRRIVVARRRKENFIMPDNLQLGIVTWNVAHFGDGDLKVASFLEKVREVWQKFTLDAASFAKKFVQYLDAYERWEYRISKLSGTCKRERATAAALVKLNAAAKRHRWVPDDNPLPDDAQDVDEDENEDEEAGALENDANDPLELARLLGGRWIAYDDRHDGDLWSDPGTLEEEWLHYFQMAIKRYSEAWSTFQAQWDGLLTIKNEEELQQEILHDVESLVLAMKDLRVAAKMVVKPVFQLRERLKFAKMLQALAKHKNKKSFEEAKKNLEEACGVSKWPIGPVFTCVEILDKAIHRVLVATHIDLMFRSNSWLDAIVLQEVNKGIDALDKYLKEHGYVCFRGFKLQSRSGKGTQTEYYPLIVRDGGRIKPMSLHALYNDRGTISFDGAHTSEPLDWNKKDEIYRPILAYDVAVGISDTLAKLVTIGVVHTTPGGREMYRKSVYDQVDVPLEILAKSSIPVVVGGDFYLTEEAVTVGWNSLDAEEQRKAEDLKDEYGDQLRKRIAGFEREIQCMREVMEKMKAFGQQIDKRIKNGTWKELENGRSQEQRAVDWKQCEAKLAAWQEQKKSLESLVNWLGSDRVQLIRNEGSLAVSVGHRIRALGLELAQPTTGTNWKTKSVLRWFDAQIADFFVYTGQQSPVESSRWDGARVGLVSPTGDLRVADMEELLWSKYWRCVSDHFPIGIILTKGPNQDALDTPFPIEGAPGSVAQGTMPKQPKRDVLGIRNEGNTCYVNAALQLAWRIGFRTNYIHGNPGDSLPAIQDAVVAFFDQHRLEGQQGTYKTSGPFGFFTSAETANLRSALAMHHQAAFGGGAQSDAGEALLKILEAFECASPGFSVGDQDQLRQAAIDNDFAQKRPSSCHFLMEIETRYTLGKMHGDPQDSTLRVDEHNCATTYDCANLLSLRLPSEDAVSPDEQDADTSVKMERPLTEVHSESLTPADLEDIWVRDWNQRFEEDRREVTPVSNARGSYPQAWASEKRIDLAVEPAHWIVQLERFTQGSPLKKRRKVVSPDQLCGKTLKGFIVHRGGSSREGHYIAYIEHGGRWHRIDDDQVMENPGDLQAARQDAYILYYE